VYVIDFAPPEPADLDDPEDGAPWSDDPGSPGYAGGPGAMDPAGGLSAAGCAVTPGRTATGSGSWTFAAVLAALILLGVARRLSATQ
jgi:hypothetical protein